MTDPRQKEPPPMPHQLILRVLMDGLILMGVVGLAVLMKAWAAAPVVPVEAFPWATVLLIVGQLAAIVLTWILKSAVTEMHVTFNSQFDQYKKLVEEAARAKGELQGRTAQLAEESARAAGRAESTGPADARPDQGAA